MPRDRHMLAVSARLTSSPCPAPLPRPAPPRRAAQGVGQNVMSYETGDGTWSGYEVELLRQLLLVELAG